jgi:hypothetical protein
LAFSSPCGSILVDPEDEQTDGRRQITVLAIRVDHFDEGGHGQSALVCYLTHRPPERIFNADARLAA